ncbi:MAG: anaerobic ribonucleoside-triphosphate reductase [Verrucomicrobiota bacterium]|nr:anaerobic ribonucleoside-triphosphate reductase [Verrucomicrobiota bacterium]MDY5597724.1 anaerobic ribonucleoside-triphosphate reductase [Kiritimatiellia bacterium]
MNIIKRSGEERTFDRDKIANAIRKANDTVEAADKLTEARIDRIAEQIEEFAASHDRALSVEEVQDIVETKIQEAGAHAVAKNYIKYRFIQELKRQKNTTDGEILSLINCTNEEAKQENANKNPTINSVQRDYMAGAVSKDVTRRLLLPQEVVRAHEDGIIHFHDMDYYAQRMHNCDLVNLEDMLQNGTVISGTTIDRPHSFSTACNIATQIIAQVASNQYGGQSISLTHLAPFVQVSREKIAGEVDDELRLIGAEIPDDKRRDMIEKRVRDEIVRGVQTIQYQVVTLMTTNGQAPFITVFMYLNEARDEREKKDLAVIIEEMLKQRIQGVKNEVGVYVTPAFPKLIYVLEEDNVSEGTPYWYLTELAAKCTAKRMVPDYISEKVMRSLKRDVYTCMGCRSFLTPDRFTDAGVGNLSNAGNYVPGKYRYYGRFNQGVVTVNLVDIALSARREVGEAASEDRCMEAFWRIFDERMELCHRALRCRHDRLVGTLSDAAPILWQYGALARLKKGEKIDCLLYNGYSTISLGYAGLWECVYAAIGKKLTEFEGEALGLDIMKRLNEYTAKWKAAENIDYSIYGTPLESSTYRFAKCLQKRFGIVKGVTDRNYITNSYHVHVTEKIDAFEKLALEAKFQALSPGGAISYVEVPNMQHNIKAVLSIMRFIYDHIMYAELNTKSDYCQKCGWDGEIEIVKDENGKLIWKCPKCGNTDQNTMNVARRTCGYIGSQYWNQGRTQEIKERVLHVS